MVLHGMHNSYFFIDNVSFYIHVLLSGNQEIWICNLIDTENRQKHFKTAKNVILSFWKS